MGPKNKLRTRSSMREVTWKRSFDFYDALLTTVRPRREVHMQAPIQQFVVVASDAQADARRPSGGYIWYDPLDGACRAGYVVFHAEVRTPSSLGLHFGAVATGSPIAICEGAMVPILHNFGTRFASRRLLYFLDNTASLHSMGRGCARQAILDRCVSIAHLLCAKFGIHIWFESVDSGSNWSDGISHELSADKFARRPIRALRFIVCVRVHIRAVWFDEFKFFEATAAAEGTTPGSTRSSITSEALSSRSNGDRQQNLLKQWLQRRFLVPEEMDNHLSRG
eukprot:5114351-Amphidinium_carterae.2